MAPDIFKNNPAILKHVLSFSASLAIHAVLIYLAAGHFVSVRIIDFREKVTEVVIAPPSKLELPALEGFPSNLPEIETDSLQFVPRRVQNPRELSAILEREVPAEDVPEPFPGPVIDPKFTSGFRLDKTPPEKAAPSPGEKLRLTVPERKIGAVEGVGGTAPRKKAGDLRRYIYSGGPGGISPSVAAMTGRRPRGSSLRSRSGAQAVLNYDLSPWARNVIEVIQKNWTVPPPLIADSDASVEIAVLILKSGEISYVEIVSPSDDREFDAAAQEAVETSSPLPPLPDDFPAASLEISFIFSKQW